MRSVIYAFFFAFQIYSICYCNIIGDSSILTFLNHEQTNVNLLQNQLRDYLSKKKIPLGYKPRSLQKVDTKRKSVKILLSTDDNHIECRVALSRAPIGYRTLIFMTCEILEMTFLK